ncbi:DUF1542 domain-containing protein, partial [Erysipelothrix aquatica]
MKRNIKNIIVSVILTLVLFISNFSGVIIYADSDQELSVTNISDLSGMIFGTRASGTYNGATLGTVDSGGFFDIRKANSTIGFKIRPNGDSTYSLKKVSNQSTGGSPNTYIGAVSTTNDLLIGNYYEYQWTMANITSGTSFRVGIATADKSLDFKDRTIYYPMRFNNVNYGSSTSNVSLINGTNKQQFHGRGEKVRFEIDIHHQSTFNNPVVVGNFKLTNITPAAVPTISVPTELSNTLSGNTTAAVNDQRPSRQGDVVQLIRVSSNGTTTSLGTTTVLENNTWMYTLNEPAQVGERYRAIITNPESEFVSTTATSDVVVANPANRAPAIQAVNEKAAELTARINQLVNVPQSEKDAAIAAIETTRANTVASINSANSTPEFNTHRDNGIAAMQDIYNELRLSDTKYLDNAKEVGKTNLNEKAQAAKDAIDALEHLTPQEKTEAKELIDTKLQEAVNAVDTAKTMSEVNNIVTTKTTEMDKVVSDAELQDAINDAIKRVQDKALDVKNRLSQIADIPEADLNVANAQVDTELEKIIADLNTSTSVAQVNQVRTDGKEKLESIYGQYESDGNQRLDDNKTVTKVTLQSDRDAALAFIDTLEHLNETEKDIYRTDINSRYNEAVTAVDNAGSLEEMQTVVDHTRSHYETTKAEAKLHDTQNDAVARLNVEAQRLNDAIDELSNLSPEQITDAKQEIEAARLSAIDKVNAALSTGVVEAERAHGFNEMQGIYDALEGDNQALLEEAKTKRSSDLETKAQAARDAVNAMNGLNQGQKDVFIATINQELQAGLSEIDQAITVADANTAEKEAGIAIDDVVKAATLQNDKENADTLLKQKADEIRTRINNIPGATQDDKDAALVEVNQILADKTDTINASTTQVEVSSALTQGRKDLEAVAIKLAQKGQNNLQNARDVASNNLDAKAQGAIDKVNENQNLTSDEKAVYIKNIETVRDSAKDALIGATDFNSITEIGNEAEARYQDEVKGAWKHDAKNVINEAANEVKGKLDVLADLPESEKQAALAKVESIRNSGLQSVEESTTQPSIRIAQEYTIDELDKLLADSEIASKRLEAIRHLEETAQAVKDRISTLVGLSDSDKEALKTEVNEELEKAIDMVNKGTNATEIFRAQDAGQKAMEAITGKAEAKSEANITDAKVSSLERIQEEAQKAKDTIDGMEFLTDEEKAMYKERIDERLQKGIEGINNATTLDVIQSVEDTTITAYESIVAEAQIKDAFTKTQNDAKKALDDKATEAKATIDAMDSITPEQKEVAKAEINQIVEDSKEAIDTATTVDAIQTSVEDGKHAIDNVVTEAKTQDAFAKAQNDAKKALDDKATEAKAAIDAMDSITPEQKEAAKAEINQIVEDSKE